MAEIDDLRLQLEEQQRQIDEVRLSVEEALDKFPLRSTTTSGGGKERHIHDLTKHPGIITRRYFPIVEIEDAGVHDHGWDDVVSGTGTAAMSLNSLRVSTAADAASTARFLTNHNEVGITRGVAADVIDWSRQVLLGFRFTLTNVTSTGALRILMGKTSADGHGALAAGRRGIGISVANLALSGQIGNGSAATTTSSLKTIVADDIYDLYAHSFGDGVVEWFLDDVSLGTSTGGPTDAGAAGESRIYVEVGNGANAAEVRATVHEVWVAD